MNVSRLRVGPCGTPGLSPTGEITWEQVSRISEWFHWNLKSWQWRTQSKVTECLIFHIRGGFFLSALQIRGACFQEEEETSNCKARYFEGFARIVSALQCWWWPSFLVVTAEKHKLLICLSFRVKRFFQYRRRASCVLTGFLCGWSWNRRVDFSFCLSSFMSLCSYFLKNKTSCWSKADLLSVLLLLFLKSAPISLSLSLSQSSS